jgi:Mn-dependent DtxR family transcriptional regulator
MAKVSPYHTDSPEYPPKHRNVYHDHDDCPDGKKIESKHRKSGTGNKLRCDECIKLG